uniref:Zinc finger protein 862-like n=1 Tax=Crassostrea virginica TaxID=6565 RepID=A0A8B8CQ13_CRAVI|nr:zinc finger protein 862-like [Crassostrea virginica]
MSDESSDVSVHQNLVVYVRYLEQAFGRLHARTSFLGLRQLEIANSDSIREQVVKLLVDKGLDVSKLAGIATDGASVMVGCREGVVQQMKALSPSLLSTHCIAHRLALSCGGAADQIPYLVKFQEILNSLYKYFHNSPKNTAKLESIQSILNASSLKMKEVFHTRWLSFEGSVEAVVRNYPSLLSVFLEEKSAKALSLHKPLSCYKFLYCAHFLSDVLNNCASSANSFKDLTLTFPLSILSNSTVSVLERLRDSKDGTVLSSFLQETPSSPSLDPSGLRTLEFKGHTIRDSSKQRDEAISACEKFVSGVIVNLRDRFVSKGDGQVMSAMCSLFDPSLIASSFSPSKETLAILVDFLQTCSFPNYQSLRSEVVGFHEFVRHSGSSTGLSTVKDLAQFGIRYSDLFPVVGFIGRRMLVLPVSTVDCGRGFSKQNLIKTDHRNSLKPESLSNLMMISIEGPTSDSFDFDQAFQVWTQMKARRILNVK